MKKNILFCIADDASHFGCYGHEFVKTPNIDQLAAQGVRFDSMFTPNPKCAPSRACILTGRYPWELEAAGNHFSYFDSKYEVYPDILENEGYHVGFTGKGWGPGDYTSGGFKRNPAGNDYSKATLRPPGNSCINKNDYTENFNRFLNDKKDDQPFCFWFGCWEPHRPYTFGENESGSIGDVDVPPFLPDNGIVRQDFLDYASEINWFDRHVGQMVRILEKRKLLDDTLIVVTSDNGMPFPRVKGHMYDNDFRLPFVVYHRGKIQPGTVVEDLYSFSDLAPTFLEAAGIDHKANMTGTSFHSILEGKESNGGHDYVYMGKELNDIGGYKDRSYPVRCIRDSRHLLVLNFRPELWPVGNPETGFTGADSSPTKTYILNDYENGITEHFDLCFGKRPAEELYDILEDPCCVNNLALMESYSEVKSRLKDRLFAKLVSARDPRMVGEGHVYDEYKYVGPDNHSWSNYDNGTWTPQDY